MLNAVRDERLCTEGAVYDTGGGEVLSPVAVGSWMLWMPVEQREKEKERRISSSYPIQSSLPVLLVRCNWLSTAHSKALVNKEEFMRPKHRSFRHRAFQLVFQVVVLVLRNFFRVRLVFPQKKAFPAGKQKTHTRRSNLALRSIDEFQIWISESRSKIQIA